MPSLPQGCPQRRLAHLDGLAAQVRAIQLQQVEGIQERIWLVPASAEHMEGSHALLSLSVRLPYVPSPQILLSLESESMASAES